MSYPVSKCEHWHKDANCVQESALSDKNITADREPAAVHPPEFAFAPADVL